MSPRRPETVTVLPSPRRLIEALRDVGYDFVGAVADLIDNSIAAQATTVDVQVRWDGPDSWLRIADNGTGMDAATVTEALRLGSERSYRPDDLGKFGLGLKTASLSQCRRISVASRTSPTRARIEARRFDLDRIIKDDKWEVEVLGPSERPAELVEPLKDGPGTVVLWSALDRVLGYRTPQGERAHRALWEMVDRLEQHLAMVFHRFLDGEARGRRRRPLVIRINNNQVQPWDPFARNEPDTQALQPREFDVSAHGASGLVGFTPFVLPPKGGFSSEAEFGRLSGPAKWNQQQGFYIYRADRLIQSGGWCRTRAPDEHTKLARIALDFFPELDAAFGINIAKMRVNLPTQLREQLKNPVEETIRVAKKAYSEKPDATPPRRKNVGGQRLEIQDAVAPAPKPKPVLPVASADAGGVPETTATAIPWPPPPLVRTRRAREALEKAAEGTGDSEALGRIVGQLRENEPEVADALGF